MTVPTIAQNAPYVWAILGASNVGIPTIPQDAPYVWTLSADANGNAITQNYFYNIVDYGAIPGDNNTNKVKNTTAITNATAAAVAAGGGIVFFPPGVWRSKNVDLSTASKVIFVGCGPGATTWKLADGENTDLLSAYVSSINLSGTAGTGPTTAVSYFGFKNITLDGNKANQSGTSYVIRFYGYGDIFENVLIQNGLSGGILRDYYGSGSYPVFGQYSWKNIESTGNGGMGIEVGGPTDARWQDVVSDGNTSHQIHICPNASGLQAINCHAYFRGIYTGLAWLIEGTGTFLNCEAEGSDTGQLVVLAIGGFTWVGGTVFSAGKAGFGIQLGQQAGQTPYAGMINQSAGVTTSLALATYFIQTRVFNISHANGAVWFSNDNGGFLQTLCNQSSGKYKSGTQSQKSNIWIMGQGLTADGTTDLGGLFQVSNKASSGVQMTNGTTQNFNVNSFASPQNMSLPNATEFRMYTDNFGNQDDTINTNGDFFGQKVISAYHALYTSTQSLATSGTVSHGNYYGFVRVTPTGNVTGVIVQVGSTDGQTLVVVNESAFTVTMAAVATSNVADGVSAVISANRQMTLTWYAASSKWFHT